MEGEALEEIKSWAKLEADFKANVEEMIKNKTHINYCGEHQESLVSLISRRIVVKDFPFDYSCPCFDARSYILLLPMGG